MCSSTYVTFCQNTPHLVGEHLCDFLGGHFHFLGGRLALDQNWFARMQEPFTRIPNLVLTRKWPSAPMWVFSRTQQRCWIKIRVVSSLDVLWKLHCMESHATTPSPFYLIYESLYCYSCIPCLFSLLSCDIFLAFSEWSLANVWKKDFQSKITYTLFMFFLLLKQTSINSARRFSDFSHLVEPDFRIFAHPIHETC